MHAAAIGAPYRVATFASDATLGAMIELTPRPTGPNEAILAEMAAFPEMNPGPVIRTDLTGKILLVNTAARQVFVADQLTGSNWLSVCPSVDRDVWERTLAGTDRLQHEAEVDGRVFAFVYRRPASVDSIFIYGNDITERKRAERLLAEQAAQIAEMARFPEMNPNPVFRVDREANVVLANVAARDLFGGDALIGRSWKELCPGLDDAKWQQILDSPDVVPFETTLGERVFLFAHRRAPNGDLVFVFGNELTQLRAAEEALRHSEKMATLGTLAAGVAHELNNPAAAAARGAGHLNEAFTRMLDAVMALGRLQLTPEQTAALRELIDGEEAKRVCLVFGNPLERSDAESAVESWLEEHDVDDAWELAPALVSLGYDVPALERLGTTWREHTPVVAEWIARAQAIPTLTCEIEEATRRVSEIVGALKSYSYLGQAPVRAVDVRKGIDDTLIIMRGKLQGIRVGREYDPDVPEIEAHGSELNQVWTNLIDNAVWAMGGSGTLTVRTRRDGDFAVVEIEDDGPGMPESVRQKVFDPFFTTKEPGKGTGLGLATSRNIVVRKHGGTIDVVSRPGRTTFSIRLPIRNLR
jgi:signal transduction histidine kinase